MHDAFFKLSQNQFYQCLDSECNEVFKSKNERSTHLKLMHSKTFLRINLATFDEAYHLIGTCESDNIHFGDNSNYQADLFDRPKKIAKRKHRLNDPS